MVLSKLAPSTARLAPALLRPSYVMPAIRESHAAVFRKRPAQLIVNRIKDVCHFYFIGIGFLPVVACLAYNHIVYGPCELKDTPKDGPPPHYWQYERTPIRQWWAKHFGVSDVEHHERNLAYFEKQGTVARWRQIEQRVKHLQGERWDYKGWHYQMLENVVAWVLNNYIGEYLENLNTDQLSVALLSGQVELDNVPLKKTALRKLDLPLEVRSGLLGKLTLSIPITHLRSEPWTLKLSDVLIVLGPCKSSKRYDVEAVEQVEQQKKEQMLQELEKRHKGELMALLGVAITSEDSWWGASLISTVVNNIQLILNNVHIRYEDKWSLPNEITFNCGVRIQKMTVQTTNSFWKPGFVESQDGVNIFKKLELKGFSMYWNSDQKLTEDIENPVVLKKALAPENPMDAYVVQPCSAELRMERNTSKFPLKEAQPRFKFLLRPDAITCELTRRQMAELRALSREWTRFERARFHRKWRPLTHIKGNAGEWWKFAFERVSEDSRKAKERRTWNFAITRARHMNAYCRAYRRRLLGIVANPSAPDSVADPERHLPGVPASISQEDRTIMKQIERDSQYTYHELQLFRETVFRRLLREKENELGLDGRLDEAFETIEAPNFQPAAPPVTVVEKTSGEGWYGYLTSFFASASNNQEKEDKSFDFGKIDLSDLKHLPTTVDVKEMEEELLDVLHESWDESTLLRRDMLFLELSMRIEHITLRFVDAGEVNGIEQRRVLALDLSGANAQVKLSPRTHYLDVQLAVNDMSVQRLITGHPPKNVQSGVMDESLLYSLAEATKILLAVGRRDSDDSPMFKMRYRRQAPRLVVHQLVEGSLRPISVMYEYNALSGLSSLFDDDPNMFTQNVGDQGSLETETSVFIESKMTVNLHIPSVTMELRRRRGDAHRRIDGDWEAGEPFACLLIQKVSFGQSQNEKYKSEVNIGIEHIELTDLLESTTYSLLTTGSKIPTLSNALSSSCPDMSQTGSSAVPKPATTVPSSLPTNSFINFASTRIGSAGGGGSKKRSAADVDSKIGARVSFMIVQPQHPLFDTVYNKTNCRIEVSMDELTLAINRRTWTALLDLLGLLGTEEIDDVVTSDEEMKVKDVTPAAVFQLSCSLRVQSWRIDMPYPANSTKLGLIRLNNAQVDTTIKLHESSDSVIVDVSADGLRIDDHTPHYSELYDSRLVIAHEKGVLPQRMNVQFVKYVGEDLQRECDSRLKLFVPDTMHLYYVHTHRFFCALLDFWQQFFELQDQLAKSKRHQVADNMRARVLLDIDIKCPTSIFLPMNQTSEQALLLESSGLRMTNEFVRLSELQESVFQKYAIDTDYEYDNSVDCLLDCGHVSLPELRCFEALRVEKDAKSKDIAALRQLGRNVFSGYHFVVGPDNVFSRRFELVIDVYRNLDAAKSHCAPDISIVTRVDGLTWQMTTDFYILLRGVLEHNFGESLIPVPETIPLEILQNPIASCEVGTDAKYASLSFRLLFDHVSLECQVPDQHHRRRHTFDRKFYPFACMELLSSRISFDVLIDGQSELDLICESTRLIDTRNAQAGSGDKNLFTTVLSPRAEASANSSGLMSEAHVMMRHDEPPLVTLVLVGARVLLLADWLDDAKKFVLLSTDFSPKYSDDLATKAHKKASVVGRGSVETPCEQSFAVKITLRDSELVIVEKPSNQDSLALVAATTAVLNMNDAGGQLAANLEIQSMKVGWSWMSRVEEINPCSNDFSMGLALSVDETKIVTKGLSQLGQIRHQLEVEVRGMIGRISYRDACVVRAVVKGFLHHYQENFGKSIVPNAPTTHTTPAKPALEIARLLVKTEHADLWILDDFQGSSIPLLRASLSRVSVEHTTERLVSALTLSCDYFNQSVFGWEPLVENWSILRLLVATKERSRVVELITESASTLDLNITEPFLRQLQMMSGRFDIIQAALQNDDFRSSCSRPRSDHLPYVLQNQTGCDLIFTTAVEDLQSARCEQRKVSVRWISVQKGTEKTFEFPTRLLLYKHSEREPPRQVMVRVAGWDEMGAVSVDACGTFFRLVKASNRASGMGTTRLVIKVSMDKDGRKVVSIRSSLTMHNQLPHPIVVYTDDKDNQIEVMRVESSTGLPVPLSFAHNQFLVAPIGGGNVQQKAEVHWKGVKAAGAVVVRTQRLETTSKHKSYWMCTSVRREHYPEQENLPGHTIHVVPPLNVQNLLPVDVELRIQEHVYPLGAGKNLQITSVDIGREMRVSVTTDRLRTVGPAIISKSQIGEGLQIVMRLVDTNNRPLDMYINVRLGTGGAVHLALWVPFWIVNKSGIPLVLKQEAAELEAAGQMDEHERAKDKHPLMFSFADDGCPKQCVVRVGKHVVREDEYRPRFSQRFALAPGVQALKLKVVHDKRPTIYYNVGVEVRAGTGRYKDTQVVLITSRYVLNNQSSHVLHVCHHDCIDRSSEHVVISPSSNVVWNERVEDERMLCVRRAEVRHWSCPFRVDRIASFHVTMRDADETPRFVRVEIALSSAVFAVTFTDAHFYPPPIRIENLSQVPVLYQQQSDGVCGQHLRTICKAQNHVDYAWDDLYGNKIILLQVYENKSHTYNPALQSKGESLTYDNHMYIQLSTSFENSKLHQRTEECELVLETLQKGKVVLNKQNRVDGNGGNQLWRLCKDGTIENIGMSVRSRQRMVGSRVLRILRYVLDVLEKGGYQLMMCERNPSREFQKWTMFPDGRLCSQLHPELMVTSRLTEVCLAKNDTQAFRNQDGVANTQLWRIQRQRPGSGILDVECLYSGPTLVVRITDREQKLRCRSMPVVVSPTQTMSIDVSVTMKSGFGMSLVNAEHEELLYARLSGIAFSAKRMGDAFNLTASVDGIQVDNQLLLSDRVPFLLCEPEQPDNEEILSIDLPAGVAATARPALKLEMNCTPMNNYIAFDCFRVKLCELSVNLNELLAWKLVAFAQASNATASVQTRSLLSPPNIELERPDPLRTRRCYFGTLALEVGQISLSVVTLPRSSLPPRCRQLKQQFNVKLVSFENATVNLPPFRQSHYFETSSFLVETLQKFYFAELQKQTLSIVVTLDAFGNPLGLVTDLKDSIQGLVIEGDVQRFVTGLGYGVSNSISKMASSMASGVGALTFDQEHEARRRHNMIRSQSTSSTPLTHLYTGVKGLGVGVFGGVTAIFTNTIAESRKSGIVSGTIRGLTTGAVDTVTKPVQGLFDLVEGTASAMKELTSTGGSRRTINGRIRPPRLCRNLYHLLPPFSMQLANAQIEMQRINGFSTKERLLDVEVCLEQFLGNDIVRQYVLISNKQAYVCKQTNDDAPSVIQRFMYKYVRSATVCAELANTLSGLEVQLDTEEGRSRPMHVWCSRPEVARRLAEKLLLAKTEYDHSKRTLHALEDEA